MKEVERVVDQLFQHVRMTEDVKELKAEIASNMEAKFEDLMNRGFEKGKALSKLQEDFVAIDGLIDSVYRVDYHGFQKECFQSCLLASLFFWILSIPTMLVGRAFAWLAFGLAVLFAVLYLDKRRSDKHEVRFVSIEQLEKIRKNAWLIWGLFFLICVLTITALQFGSNIWFGRVVTFQGPYDFANKLVNYYIALTTIAFPIAISRLPAYLDQYLEGETHE